MGKITMNAEYQRNYRKNRVVVFQKMQQRDHDRIMKYAEDRNLNSKIVFINGLNEFYKKVNHLNDDDRVIEGLAVRQSWKDSMGDQLSDVGLSWTIEQSDKDKLDYISEELNITYKEIWVHVIRKYIPMPLGEEYSV